MMARALATFALLVLGIASETAFAGSQCDFQEAKGDIRWMIHVDRPAVAKISRRSNMSPAWTIDQLAAATARRHCIGTVFERRNSKGIFEILGYMVYELHDTELRIIHMAVEPTARNQGIGTRMIQRVQDKLSQQRRRSITVVAKVIPEYAKDFFGKLGFSELEGSGNGPDIMQYTLPGAEPALEPGEEIEIFGDVDEDVTLDGNDGIVTPAEEAFVEKVVKSKRKPPKSDFKQIVLTQYGPSEVVNVESPFATYMPTLKIEFQRVGYNELRFQPQDRKAETWTYIDEKDLGELFTRPSEAWLQATKQSVPQAAR